MSIERERRRLDRAFRALLLALGSPAIMVACGSSGPTGGGEGAGGPETLDATLDGPPGAQDSGRAPIEGGGTRPSDAAAADVAKPLPVEAGPDARACSGGVFSLDAGPDAGDAQDTCGYVYACGLSGTGLVNVGCGVFLLGADGAALPLSGAACWVPEEAGCEDDAFAPGEGEAVTVVCSPCPNGGRRPAGLVRPRTARGKTAMGAYLASMAFEEGASVIAFERMRVELALLGAPATLVRAAERATRDERRHARVMARLASEWGGCVTRPRIRRPSLRGATAIAAENAAEGCVRETYGALLARWQSLYARDARTRETFARVAADEARHAALSWALARWIEPRLEPEGRRRVVRSRARALRSLATSLEVEPRSDLVVEAGLPDASTARALLEGMSRALGVSACRTSPTRAGRRRSPRRAAPSP